MAAVLWVSFFFFPLSLFFLGSLCWIVVFLGFLNFFFWYFWEWLVHERLIQIFFFLAYKLSLKDSISR